MNANAALSAGCVHMRLLHLRLLIKRKGDVPFVCTAYFHCPHVANMISDALQKHNSSATALWQYVEMAILCIWTGTLIQLFVFSKPKMKYFLRVGHYLSRLTADVIQPFSQSDLRSPWPVNWLRRVKSMNCSFKSQQWMCIVTLLTSLPHLERDPGYSCWLL